MLCVKDIQVMVDLFGDEVDATLRSDCQHQMAAHVQALLQAGPSSSVLLSSSSSPRGSARK